MVKECLPTDGQTSTAMQARSLLCSDDDPVVLLATSAVNTTPVAEPLEANADIIGQFEQERSIRALPDKSDCISTVSEDARRINDTGAAVVPDEPAVHWMQDELTQRLFVVLMVKTRNRYYVRLSYGTERIAIAHVVSS